MLDTTKWLLSFMKTRIAALVLHGASLAVIGISLVALGCQADKIVSSASSAIPNPWYDATQAQSIDRLAQVFAKGLADGEARSALHAALRDSPLSEHKLILSSYVASASGQRLIQAAARSSGLPSMEIERLVALLPPVDLYMPYKAHRWTWLASTGIAVSALVDKTSPVVAYLADGGSVPLDRGSAEAPATPVLLLGPTEPKMVRRDVGQPVADLTVIESKAARMEHSMAERSMLLDGQALHIDTLATWQVCDNNFCPEGNEFELHATDANGSVQSPVWRCDEIGSTDTVEIRGHCAGTGIVHNSAPSEVAYIDVDVVETDGGFNPDDHFLDWGSPPTSPVHPPRVSSGHTRLRLHKNPPTAYEPVVLVTFNSSFDGDMSGLTTITEPNDYTWSATAAGGTGSYTYDWSYRNVGSSNWITIGHQQTQARYVDASTPAFTLRVQIFSETHVVYRDLSVAWISPPAGECGHWEVRPVLDGNGEETGSYENVWVPEECNPPPCTDGHWESQPILDGNGEETGSYQMVWVLDPGCE